MEDGLQYRVFIVSYPAVQQAAVLGLQDLFSIAQQVQARSNDRTHCKIEYEIVTSNRLRQFEPSGRNILIIPPSLGSIPSSEENRVLISAILWHYKNGTIVTSVCAGTFVLAETGALNNREATTHWAYADILSQRFPQVHVRRDKLLIDTGSVITAGGLMAWTDLGLQIIKRTLGEPTMRKTAQFMLMDLPGREQGSYIVFAPNSTHQDRAILKAQHLVDGERSDSPTVEEMIKSSGLERRTFLRRFKKATGITPKRYILQHRIEKAKVSLQSTSKPIEQISWEAGYHNTSAFRRIFTEMTKLPPREYRRRFSGD